MDGRAWALILAVIGLVLGVVGRLRARRAGSDKVPPQRRLVASRGNSAGWEAQLENVARHVTE